MNRDCAVIGCYLDATDRVELETEIGTVEVLVCSNHLEEANEL